MIIPQYWAERSACDRRAKRQITVKRFGWSDISEEDAEGNAQRRADEALARLLAGENLTRREPKVAYNGADGIPIREEIVSRHGSCVVTRNSYGARCLNSPDALFADVDHDFSPSLRIAFGFILAAIALGIAVGSYYESRGLKIGLPILAVLFGYTVIKGIYDLLLKLRGGPEMKVLRSIRHFLKKNPGWSIRIYRTPAGNRLLATHRTFSPSEPAVMEFFKSVGADPIYQKMCMNQQCFRARVTAKPWRVGITGPMRLKGGVWPVVAERRAARSEWIERYESAARSHAACRFVETAGSGVIAPDLQSLVDLHDDLSRAHSDLKTA